MPSSDSRRWSEVLLCGIEEMDRQHRILVDTLTEAKSSLTDEAGGRLFEQITCDLLAYALYHFETEEQLMRRSGYAAAAPEAAASHLAQHRHFSAQIVALRAAARRGDGGNMGELLPFVEDWLANHILTTDRHLAQFIGAAAAGRRQGEAP